MQNIGIEEASGDKRSGYAASLQAPTLSRNKKC